MLSAIVQVLRGPDRKVVLLHGNADPDALGSAYALKRAFPEMTIAAPGGLDRVSKVIAGKLDIKVLEAIDLADYEVILAVDSSSPDQLGTDLGDREVIRIDHHATNGDWKGSLRYVDEERRSCAEMVFDLLREAEWKADRLTSLALAAGMLTDSGHFRFANPATLRTLAALMEEGGVNMDEVMDLTDLEPDVSERVSQLKGAQRLRFERVGEHIVAISLGSAHESSVCKSILNVGADIAFVGSQRDERFRISARARQDMVRKGLHLGKLLDELGGETKNSGGGHAGAAGLTGVGDVEAMLNICMSKTMAFLRTLRNVPVPSDNGRE